MRNCHPPGGTGGTKGGAPGGMPGTGGIGLASLGGGASCKSPWNGSGGIGTPLLSAMSF